MPSEVVTELIQRGPAEALAGLLGVPMPEHRLPLFWHWIYLLDRPAQADLGRDGHPDAAHVPPGRRRMFAGGSVRSLAPLRFDEVATRRTEVIASTDKPGRSGPLTFVTVGHQVFQRDELVVDERQEIVYREPGAQEPPPQAPEQPAGEDEWAIEISPTLLFRFSALTYNGHRIHYDRDYARDVEGYPGLVTHGPLQALAMAEHARARGVSATRCQFRLIAPLFEQQGLIAGADYVRDRGGRRTAQGTVA